MILGTGIRLGDSIKTKNTPLPHAWLKILEITPDGVMTNAGFVAFGSRIYGWKK